MSRRINWFIASVIILWIAIFIFQKEVLAFIGGWSPSFVRDGILRAVIFMLYIGDQAVNLVKIILNWLVSAAGRVVSGADPLYGLIKWFANVFTGIIKWIIAFVAPIFGK